MNSARSALLDGRYFTDLDDEDLQQITDGLTGKAFHALYGDYDYKARTIGGAEKIHWVPHSLRPTVEAHFEQFKTQFGDIHGQSWEAYSAQRAADQGPSFGAGVA